MNTFEMCQWVQAKCRRCSRSTLCRRGYCARCHVNDLLTWAILRAQGVTVTNASQQRFSDY